jgi:glycosyltransferase involved in cell wall biosynthesis
MRMPTPSATVVIPCFNHGRFVRQAVDSALAQKDADIRVVIVEDGSTDGETPAACDACAGERVRVIHQENRGLPAARNRGAAGADTEFFVFLDADDWIEREFVGKLAAAIQADGGADVSHAYCQERLVEKGNGIWKVPEWDSILMMVTNLHPVTTLVRRERFEEVGGFDETMRNGYEDWDLWLKFVERGWRGVRVAEPLFIWRRHSHTTMIMNVIRDHESLFAAIRERHRELYARHGAEIIVRSNTIMNRAEMGWLDESGEPINLRALKRQRGMYESIVAVRVQRRLQKLMGRRP